MCRRFIALTAVFLLAASVWAGDPWKDKAYKQWDEKDIRKVMTESPWVRAVRVENTWGGPSIAEAPTLGASGSAASSDPRDISRGAKPLAGVPAEAVFVVHWASSRTIRRAQARRAVLGGVQEAVAENFLMQEPAEYQVVVLGTDMAPFAKVEEKELKENSYLGLRKAKNRLSAERIEIERTPDGSKVLAVHFYFAKKTEAGQPTFSADERGADFVCLAGKITLKTSFDFQRMTDNQGIDL